MKAKASKPPLGRCLPALGLGQRVAYGAGELGPAMAGSTLVFFQLIFLTDVAGMHPGWAGSVLLLARIWDAINDPLIGWLSDHTRSRWGRRLPWIAVGAVPFAFFFCLFWLGPMWLGPESGQGVLFLYYSVVSLLYSTVTTALALPHSALTAELSHDYDERSRLTSARMAFSLGGSVGGLILALIIFRALPEAGPLVQYSIFGACVALVGLISVVGCLWGIWPAACAAEVWRLSHPQARHKQVSLLRQLRSVLSNRPFLLVCGIYLCSWLAMQFTAGVLPFYTATVMGLPATAFQQLALTVQATALVLIPFWTRVSVWRGKKEVFFYGMIFWIMAQGGLLFLPAGQMTLLYVLAILAGIGISVCYLIPNALLPDVLEWDELRTGQRREGLYFGVCVFLQKVALAVGTFLIGQVLAWSGYVSGGAEEVVHQPESAVQAIRWAIGPLPAGVLILGLVVAWFYPISRPLHARMVRVLENRARRKN